MSRVLNVSSFVITSEQYKLKFLEFVTLTLTLRSVQKIVSLDLGNWKKALIALSVAPQTEMPCP